VSFKKVCFFLKMQKNERVGLINWKEMPENLTKKTEINLQKGRIG
jgi:predicted metal-binding protein